MVAEIFLQIFLIAAVISALGERNIITEFDAWVIALYIFVFALILICFECCSSLCAFVLATNFGFM